MATSSARLGLVQPDPAEDIDVTVLNRNFDLLDRAAGAVPCTSSTRPSQPFSGQLIYETDTDLTWVYEAGEGWNEIGLAVALVHTIGTASATLTLDAAAAQGSIKTITLGAAHCTFSFVGAVNGQATSLELILTQDSTGGRTVIWPTGVRWNGGTVPTLSTAPSAVDRIVLTSYDGGVRWYGDVIGLGYA